MKAFVVCAALLASAQAAQFRDVPSASLRAMFQAKWSSFKAKHGKEYQPHEEEQRLSLFVENTRHIEEHNTRFHQGLESFRMAHNELSDLSLEEIQNTRMGFVLPADAESVRANASLHVSAPSVSAAKVVDWRAEGCVQRVKNQGTCGSCYTFSAIGALETAYCAKHGKYLADMSEQHLVDCAGRGCSGGWMHDMFSYLKANGGSSFQSEYPYTGKVGQCNPPQRRVAQVECHKMVRRGDEDDLLNAVATVGTVSIAYNASTRQHAYYQGGILDVPNCGNRSTHAVLVVGYGTEGGVDYWLIKNSWGENWGEQGYFRMVRGKNMCGIADWASYPTAV